MNVSLHAGSRLPSSQSFAKIMLEMFFPLATFELRYLVVSRCALCVCKWEQLIRTLRRSLPMIDMISVQRKDTGKNKPPSGHWQYACNGRFVSHKAKLCRCCAERKRERKGASKRERELSNLILMLAASALTPVNRYTRTAGVRVTRSPRTACVCFGLFCPGRNMHRRGGLVICSGKSFARVRCHFPAMCVSAPCVYV